MTPGQERKKKAKEKAAQKALDKAATAKEQEEHEQAELDGASWEGEAEDWWQGDEEEWWVGSNSGFPGGAPGS